MGGEKRERARIICGRKKRLIAMVGCEGGQCNAVRENARGGDVGGCERQMQTVSRMRIAW